MVSCLGDLGDDLESLALAPDPDEDGDLWRRGSEVVPPWPPENVGVGDRGRSRSRSRRRVSLSSQFHASNSMFLRLCVSHDFSNFQACLSLWGSIQSNLNRLIYRVFILVWDTLYSKLC